MNYTKIKTWIGGHNKIFIFWIILAFAIPISLSVVLSIPILKTLSLIVSTFALEYFAVPVGIGLGLDPVFVLIVVTSVALSAVLLMFKIFDTVGGKSRRVSNFLSKSRERGSKIKDYTEVWCVWIIASRTLFRFLCLPGNSMDYGMEKRLCCNPDNYRICIYFHDYGVIKHWNFGIHIKVIL